MNTTLPHAKRLDARFDAERMAAEVANIPVDEWTTHPYSIGEGIWTGVALRSKDGSPRSLEHGDQYCDTPLFAKTPYLKEVADWFKCEKARIRLLGLKPGGRIGTHRDSEPTAENDVIRLHIPIVTHDGVVFTLNDKVIDLDAGDLWFLDVTQLHSVENNGTTTRVHYVLDCLANNWILDLIGAD